MPRVERNRWLILRTRGGGGGTLELVHAALNAAEMREFVDSIIDEPPPEYAQDETLYSFGPVIKLNKI